VIWLMIKVHARTESNTYNCISLIIRFEISVLLHKLILSYISP